MKITVEHYDEIYMVEFTKGTTLPKVLRSVCDLLVASGYSRENIIEYFNADRDDDERPNNPWEWEV